MARDPETVVLLRDRTIADQHSAVRRAAMRALAPCACREARPQL